MCEMIDTKSSLLVVGAVADRGAAAEEWLSCQVVSSDGLLVDSPSLKLDAGGDGLAELPMAPSACRDLRLDPVIESLSAALAEGSATHRRDLAEELKACPSGRGAAVSLLPVLERTDCCCLGRWR